MNNACPISLERINERIARVNGAFTVLSMIVFLFTPFKAIVLILGADLFIRGFLKSEYSFYSLLSRTLLQVFNINPVMTNAGPKIFAAKVGFVFCFGISLFDYFAMPLAAQIFAAMLMFFAFLEAAVGFCVACRMYPYMPDFVK